MSERLTTAECPAGHNWPTAEQFDDNGMALPMQSRFVPLSCPTCGEELVKVID